MNQDDKIWRFILKEKRFFSFSEVKEKLELHSQTLTNSLRRLEREGRLLRDIQVKGSQPVNRYLGIDSSDPKIEATIHDDHGWLWASVAWTEEDGPSTIISGIDLGEIGGRITQIGSELILKWPKWIDRLADKGKATYKTTEK